MATPCRFVLKVVRAIIVILIISQRNFVITTKKKTTKLQQKHKHDFRTLKLARVSMIDTFMFEVPF